MEIQIYTPAHPGVPYVLLDSKNLYFEESGKRKVVLARLFQIFDDQGGEFLVELFDTTTGEYISTNFHKRNVAEDHHHEWSKPNAMLRVALQFLPRHRFPKYPVQPESA